MNIDLSDLNFSALLAVRDELRSILIERDEEIDLAILALLAKQHVVLLGPPGVAKSKLIEELMNRLGLTGFQLLMRRDTVTDEVFGPTSLAGLKEDRYRRNMERRLPTAHVAFLDEIFKANSAVLNSLLLAMNERCVDDDGYRLPIPLMSVFAASNELPQEDGLGALWDRLLLRKEVADVSAAGFHKLQRLPDPPPPPTAQLKLADLEAFQTVVRAVPIPAAIMEQIAELRATLAAEHINPRSRRWMAANSVLQANALLFAAERGKVEVTSDDLLVLAHILWEEPVQAELVARLVSRSANPLLAQARELLDAAQSVYDQAMADVEGASGSQKATIALEANEKLKTATGDAAQLRGSGPRVEEVIDRVNELQESFAMHILKSGMF